jgi:hypothetical protein
VPTPRRSGGNFDHRLGHLLADPVRAADGLLALFGVATEEARDGATLLAASLIQYASGTWPKAPPDDDEE